MMRHLRIGLGTAEVGRLWGDDQHTRFGFDPEYLVAPSRPVLGQYFEDRLGPRAREHRGVHPWFENVLPERDSLVRNRLLKELGLAGHDDLGLLAALGEGLPGATVAREDSEPGPDRGVVAESDDDRGTVLRQSLGGMQLKFTLSGPPDRLSVPVRGDAGVSWILKLAGPEWPGLVENEASILAWCRAGGFDVPEVRVIPREAFPPLGELPDVRSGFLIRRYDRVGATRLHQEDFLQVLGRRPTEKYVATDALGLARLAGQVLGPDGLLECLRRLTVVVATGNADAHLKNWSLLYPDGVQARWAPLYDQVATIAFPALEPELALRIGTARRFVQVELAHLLWLAEKSGGRRSEAEEVIAGTLERLRAAFEPDALGMPSSLAERVRSHWTAVPLLRPYGPL